MQQNTINSLTIKFKDFTFQMLECFDCLKKLLGKKNSDTLRKVAFQKK